MTKFLGFFLTFSILLGMSFTAQAATEDTRYFVKSTSNFWKKSFGVRHSFGEGFTTDATEWQLRLAKVFGVAVEPVKKLYVLPADIAPVDSPVSAGSTGSLQAKPPAVVVRPQPSDRTPWGIEVVYDESLVASTSGGTDINVAVLDSGVNKSHPDLKGNIKECRDFTSAKAPFLDGKCDDKNGHGTHVAGIIAANGGSDNLGIYGVAPEANILAYKVCMNNGSCWSDDVAVAIRTAADQGAHIINLSLGSDSESRLIKDAVNYAISKNSLVVAAAGNDGPYSGSIDYPAFFKEVIGVGALDSNLLVTEWSSRGTSSISEPFVKEDGDIEFAAPGANIESTWKDGGYVILSGTSMAAPHISGLAAKLWQKDAENPADATRSLLRQFSKDLLPLGDDDASGWGLPTL